MSQERRTILTSISRSEKWKKSTADARTLWVQILCRVDNYGFMEGDEDVVWAMCMKPLGYAVEESNEALKCLFGVGMVKLLEHDGTPWVYLEGFEKAQSADFRRKRGKKFSPNLEDCREKEVYAALTPPLRRPNGALTAPSKDKDKDKDKDKKITLSESLPPKNVDIKKKPETDFLEQIETIKNRLGSLSPFASEMVDILAEENKTGKVRARRALTTIWEPLLEVVEREEFTDEALRYGLSAAVRAGAANINYARKAARGYQPLGKSRILVEPRYSTTSDDEWNRLLSGGAE